MDYTVPAINREFGSVFLGDKNVALLVVAAGWAKVFCFYLYLIRSAALSIGLHFASHDNFHFSNAG